MAFLLKKLAWRNLWRHQLSPRLFLTTRTHVGTMRPHADFADDLDTLAAQQLQRPQEPSTSIASTLATMKNAKTPTDVIQAIQPRMATFEHGQLMDALRAIFRTYKALDPDEQTKQNLASHKGFNICCDTLKHRARALDPNDTIEAFKILTYLQVPISSTINQTLLELLRGHLNSLNIRQIMFLHFLLNKHESRNNLVDALKLALPFVFQIHLPLEIDTDDLNLLKDSLIYACYNKLPDKSINNIVTGILLQKDLGLEDAKTIMWALTDVNCDEDKYPSRNMLLRKCYDVLTYNIECMKFEDVLKTVAKMKSRVVAKHYEFYSEKFADAAADYVIKKALDFDEALLIGRVLSRIAHTHLRLMEYLCDKALTNKDVLANARTNTLFSFINCLANNNYTPDETNWYMLQRHINCNPILDVKTTALPWAKVSLELASLGCYNEKLISKIFSTEFLDEFLNRDDNKMDHIQLLTMQEAVAAFRPDLNYSMPEDVATKAKELYPVHAVSAVLGEYLAYGLGSQDYVARNIALPSGLVMDLLVAVRQGYPVQMNKLGDDTKTPIKDLELKDYTLNIGFLAFHRGCFSMNSNRLRGTFNLLIKIMEQQGFLIVPVNVNEWLELNQSEKATYLVRELSHKCSEVGVMLHTQMGN